MKELIKGLPTSWNDITLEMYTKLLDCKVSDENGIVDTYQNIINFAAILMNKESEEFDSLSMKDINEIIGKLDFIFTDIQQIKSDKFKWKSLEEITMDDYISFVQLGEKQLYHMDKFIKLFNKIKLTDEEINKLPIGEVLYGFFLYMNLSKRYLNNLILSEQIKIVKLLIKKKIKAMFKRTKK